jgi:iron complex outermembrane receptor protein
MNVGRGVASAYGEALIPVVGEGNALPFVRKVDFSLSGRYDDYVGLYTTTNPHFALGWESLPGVTLRANYSTSFVAPQLSSVGNMAANDLTTYSGYSASNQALNNVPLASFPQAALVPGATCTATACNIGSNVNGISVNGNKPGLQPGRGQSWSVGFDLAPSFLPHFHSNFALFNVNLSNQVSGSSASNDINSVALHDNLTFFPTGATAAQIAQYTYGYPQLSAIAPTVYYILSVRGQNLLNLYVQGIDADARYDIPTTKAGTFRVGGSMTYFTKFNQNIAGGPTFSVLNTTGYNNTFPSIQLQGRGNLGWDLAPLSTDLFVNFVGAYKNWSSTALNALVIQNGFPSGAGGDRVDATTTLDLHFAYDFSGHGLHASQVYLDVSNLLNSQPAFYNSANGYDSYAGNILGRVVSAGFRLAL